MNEERKTLEQREQMTDLERSASFGVARAGGGNFENLGGRLFGCPVVAFRVAIKGQSAQFCLHLAARRPCRQLRTPRRWEQRPRRL